jgi:hypothetical protein
LKHEKANERFALACMKLDDYVTGILMAGDPLNEDGHLCGSQWALIVSSVERVVELDRIGRLYRLIASQMLFEVDHCVCVLVSAVAIVKRDSLERTVWAKTRTTVRPR